jgi:hypothetical protein
MHTYIRQRIKELAEDKNLLQYKWDGGSVDMYDCVTTADKLHEQPAVSFISPHRPAQQPGAAPDGQRIWSADGRYVSMLHEIGFVAWSDDMNKGMVCWGKVGANVCVCVCVRETLYYVEDINICIYVCAYTNILPTPAREDLFLHASVCMYIYVRIYIHILAIEAHINVRTTTCIHIYSERKCFGCITSLYVHVHVFWLHHELGQGSTINFCTHAQYTYPELNLCGHATNVVKKTQSTFIYTQTYMHAYTRTQNKNDMAPT